MKTDNLRKQLKPFIAWTARYRAMLFFVALGAVYGYVIVRINTLSNVTVPADSSTSSTSNQVHVDPDVVAKLQQLQNTSVSVQALFNQARQNPFQE